MISGEGGGVRWLAPVGRGFVKQRLRFGHIDVCPDERRVLVDGVPAALGGRAFDLLMVLLENRERVVGKEELLARVWPGAVVEEGNLAVQVSALRKVFGPDAISTVAGRGYRFTAAPRQDRPTAPGLAPAHEAVPAMPDKPSIAVLPFLNLSDDPEQEYFTDGITEDILTELARFQDLFVIARNSSFTYKGKAVDVRTIGRELGVRYVTEGSIRRSGDRIRVTAQLIDALSAAHLWAERYDRVVDDVFAVQQEITASIVASIAPQVGMAEMGRLRKAGLRSLSAYEFALRARSAARQAHVGSQRAFCEQAVLDATRALEIEPDNLIALEVLATTAAIRMQLSDGSDPSAAFEEGMAAVTRGLAIDPSWLAGHVNRGWLLMFTGRPELEVEALSALRRAHRLNPNYSLGLFALGFAELAAGNDEGAVASFTNALRLSPRDVLAYQYHAGLGLARIAQGDYEAALQAATSALDAAPDYALGHVVMTMAFGGIGQPELARASFDRAQRLSPGYVQRLLDDRSMVRRNAQLRSRGLPLLRIAAGMPETGASARQE